MLIQACKCVGPNRDRWLTGHHQHMLLRFAFTFAALSWVATSPLHATNSPTYPEDEFSKERIIAPKQPSLGPRPENISGCSTNLFASDELQGIQTCPTAINCQISLLSYERARKLEHNILLDLQELLDKADDGVNSADTFFVIYCTLALLMDAYEYYVIWPFGYACLSNPTNVYWRTKFTAASTTKSNSRGAFTSWSA